jgi:hypothetical protein
MHLFESGREFLRHREAETMRKNSDAPRIEDQREAAQPQEVKARGGISADAVGGTCMIIRRDPRAVNARKHGLAEAIHNDPAHRRFRYPLH